MRLRLIGIIAFVAALAAGVSTLAVSMADGPSQLPRRAVVGMVARDEGAAVAPAATARPTPPPGPGYCLPGGQGIPTPPNALFGLLTIGGVPAPAGTIVYLTFDGKPGSGVYTAAAGGYSVFYAAGGQGHEPPCINQVGSEIGVEVNGTVVGSGVHVGDPAANPALRFDVAIP